MAVPSQYTAQDAISLVFCSCGRPGFICRQDHQRSVDDQRPSGLFVAPSLSQPAAGVSVLSYVRLEAGADAVLPSPTAEGTAHPSR